MSPIAQAQAVNGNGIATENNGIVEEQIKALVLHKPHDLRLQHIPHPGNPAPHEILMKVHNVGICGTDIHLWEEAKLADIWTVKEPLVIGHEMSATVVAVGSNVTHLKPGDRVCVEPASACSHVECLTCKSGLYNHCNYANFESAGLPPAAGFFAKYVRKNAAHCYKLPDSVSNDIGAAIEPLAIAVHAAIRAQATVNQDVLVCGAGPMGVLCMQVAQAYGARRVVITDIQPAKLKFAKELGADETILIEQGGSNKEYAERIREIFGGKFADVTYECTGAGPSVELGIYSTRCGGKIVLIGCGAGKVSIPLTDACIREIDLLGLCRYRNTFNVAIDLVAQGKLPNLEKMITHKFPFSRALDAFQTMKDGRDSKEGKMAVKVIIQVDTD